MPSMMEPLTWHRAFTVWQFSPVVTLLAAAAIVGYALAVQRGYRRGVRWPALRTTAFMAGAVVAALALQSSIDAYSMTLYWLHMVQHLILIMVVPALVVLGQPWRLAESGGGRVARVAHRSLHGRVGAVATMPGLTLAFYAAVLIGTHLTHFMPLMATHPWLHWAEAAAYLLSGYLFLLPLLGDEGRWRVPYLLRVFWLMVGMGVDTLVGVVLMTTTSDALSLTGMPAPAWAPSPLDDLHTGGGVMWVFGDGLMLLFAIVAVNQWIRDTDRRDSTGSWLEAARRSALGNLATTSGGDATRFEDAEQVDDDASLEAYNRMLASLAERDRRPEVRERDDQRAGR